MLLDLVIALQRWEAHVQTCPQCRAFDDAPSWGTFNNDPCGIGRALILNLLKLLERGL